MGLLSLVSTLIFALFFQHHSVVLVQVEAVCLVMHQKVAQGQVYSRRLIKHQLSALEHQQLLEEHLVCNIELLPSLHACVVVAQKWNCLHLYYAIEKTAIHNTRKPFYIVFSTLLHVYLSVHAL